MPVPDDDDLFFGMEGDPLYPNGLEYLFAEYYSKDGEKLFRPFWAHEHDEENESFKRFMGFCAVSSVARTGGMAGMRHEAPPSLWRLQWLIPA